jgi:hypothetical protein
MLPVGYDMLYRQILIDFFCGTMPAVRPGPLPKARNIVLAVIFSLLAETGFSIAGERPASEPPPAAEPAPWPGPVPPTAPVPWADTAPWPGPVPWPAPAPWFEPGPPAGYLKAFGKTLDETHAMLQRNILKQATRFDNYFGSSKPEQQLETGYDLRWRNSVRLEHGKDVSFGTTFLGNFALSRISERLHLFIAAENEPGLTTRSLPQDPGYPGFDRTAPTAHFANTELRYEAIQKPDVNLFLGAGVEFKLPLAVFARSRVQYTRNLGDISLMRVAETFYVKTDDFLGETTEFSLERRFGEATLLRWASAGTASEKFEGLEWGSVLSLFRQLSTRNSITLSGGVFSNTTHPNLLQNYQILARYRQNFFRNWLFYELEPQISWPQKSDGSHPAILAFTFRIEVMFQKTAAATFGDDAISHIGKN